MYEPHTVNVILHASFTNLHHDDPKNTLCFFFHFNCKFLIKVFSLSVFIYKLSEAPLIKIESLCMMQSFVLKGREMLNHDATWNLHLWTLKEFLFSTLFCTHLKIVCLNATKYAREVEEEPFSRLYSVHTLDFFCKLPFVPNYLLPYF